MEAHGRTRGRRVLAWTVGLVVATAAVWTVVALWTEIAAAGAGVVQALWTLPLIVAVHAVQLLLSSVGWRMLFLRDAPGMAALSCIRLVREGVNSLLPVAHVGGEVAAIRLLAARGVGGAQATASMVVDVTMEVCSQLAFLLAGLLALGWLRGTESTWLWAGSVATAAAVTGGLLLMQRFGALRALEAVIGAIGRRWPGGGPGGGAEVGGGVGGGLAGLNAEAQAIYRHGRRLLAAVLLQTLAWSLGTVETWVVLQALGIDASWGQALVIESLGAAARSAGFAVPGALAIQETGYALAGMAVGLSDVVGLSLSLVKRVREVLVGLVGLACWQAMRAGRLKYH